MTPKSAAGGKLLRVGFTGHRPNRMPEHQWQRIKKDLSRVMAGIERSHAGRRPVLLSGLAEGADRLAAFVALGRGWSLRAILAFHRTRFEKDFPDPFAQGEFRALLDACETIEEPKRKAHVRRPSDDGYDTVGQRLLALSEVLIAVWDGKGSRGRGGTVDVIDKARARGIPVVWIHAKKALSPQHLPPTLGSRGRKRSTVRRSSAPAVPNVPT